MTRVSGDKDHPANFGSLCTKGSTVHQTIHTPDRLAHAQRRAPGGAFERVPLDVALQGVADGFRRIIGAHGPGRRGTLHFRPAFDGEPSTSPTNSPRGFLRTNNIDSNSRLCMASAASGYTLFRSAPTARPGTTRISSTPTASWSWARTWPIATPFCTSGCAAGSPSGAKLDRGGPRAATATGRRGDALTCPCGPEPISPCSTAGCTCSSGWAAWTGTSLRATRRAGERMAEVLDAYPPARVAEITGPAPWTTSSPPRQRSSRIARAGCRCGRWGLNQSARGTWNVNALCNLHLATGQLGQPGHRAVFPDGPAQREWAVARWAT